MIFKKIKERGYRTWMPLACFQLK